MWQKTSPTKQASFSRFCTLVTSFPVQKAPPIRCMFVGQTSGHRAPIVERVGKGVHQQHLGASSLISSFRIVRLRAWRASMYAGCPFGDTSTIPRRSRLLREPEMLQPTIFSTLFFSLSIRNHAVNEATKTYGAFSLPHGSADRWWSLPHC